MKLVAGGETRHLNNKAMKGEAQGWEFVYAPFPPVKNLDPSRISSPFAPKVSFQVESGPKQSRNYDFPMPFSRPILYIHCGRPAERQLGQSTSRNLVSFTVFGVFLSRLKDEVFRKRRKLGHDSGYE